MDVLLIHSPVSKPGEPPAGPPKLAGALRAHGISCAVIDANIEGLRFLLEGPVQGEDTWTRRSIRHLSESLRSLETGSAFGNIDRYIQAVSGINRVLASCSKPFHAQVSLNNYARQSYSPLHSTDLIRAAEHPEESVFYSYFSKRLTGLLNEHSPRIVGFSLNYLSQALTTFSMAGFVRRLSGRTTIVLGGGLVTSWVRGLQMSNPFSGLVDELVAGPGETRLIEISGGRCLGRDALPDFSDLGPHAYLSPAAVVPVSLSEGCCWGRCLFCPERAEGSRYRGLHAEKALEHLEALAPQETTGLVHVCDNAMSPALLKALAGRQGRTPWYGFARVTPHLTDPEFCAALKSSGCVMLKLGLESGDQDVLDRLGKGIRLEDSVRALRALKSAGIATYVYLLFGTPPEDAASARKTMELIAGNAPYIDFVNLSLFNLPRGSPDADRLSTYDFSEGDLSLYQGFVHPSGWDRRQVRRFLDRELKRHPAIARIVRADPPSFTSNHAPFFVMERA